MAADQRQTPPLNDTMQVLILDDEEAVTRAVWRQLDELPADIHRCCTVDEANRIAEQHQIDVALIDHNLVGSSITGLEYLIELQRRNPFCFRIIFTGEADFHFAVEAINQGNVDAFLPKPWNDEQLRMVVRQGAQTAWLRQHNSLLHEHLTQQNDQLNTFNAQLEELVHERTAKLENANLQLGEANRELKNYQRELVHVETQAAISQMVQGLAHELNNPLAVILGYAQRYQRRHQDDEKLSKCFRIIREEGERARTLISELRRFATRDSDPAERCSMEDLFSAASKRLQERHRRLLPCYLHGEDLFVLIGRRSMVQALEQIIENANENEGTSRIDVRCDYVRGRLHMFIDNDGEPPSEDAIRHAAKPFFTTKGIDHPGLGLSLAASLIGSMGCSLRLDAHPGGEGTRIILVFPPEANPETNFGGLNHTHVVATMEEFQQRMATSDRAERAAATTDHPGLEPTPHSSATITVPTLSDEQPAADDPAAPHQPTVLVLDDEAMVLELMADTCADAGLATINCSGVSQALEVIRSKRIDHLISDANLDDGDIGDFIDQVIAIQPSLLGHILLVTGDPERPAVVDLAQRYNCPILAKPFRIAQFNELVSQWS